MSLIVELVAVLVACVLIMAGIFLPIVGWVFICAGVILFGMTALYEELVQIRKAMYEMSKSRRAEAQAMLAAIDGLRHVNDSRQPPTDFASKPMRQSVPPSRA